LQILFTFILGEERKLELENDFPNENFHFVQNIDESKSIWHEVDILVTYGDDLDEENISVFENLKWIMVASAGIEKMPMKFLEEKNILVTNARGIHKKPMAEYTMGCLLDYVKNRNVFNQSQRENEWKTQVPIAELGGLNLLIVGTGAIGIEIGRLANAFGMNVFGINSDGRTIEGFDSIYSLDQISEILPNSDFIVSILPSTPETKYVWSMSFFKKMKETAVFINIGRGDAVSLDVLISALENKKINHAYLDVFEKEPLPEDHPLWTMENVSITPHISSHSKKYIPRALEIFKENLQSYLKLNKAGSYKNKVNLERGY
jgi:phosphoglycerate dehydrogenase-like enzyme